MGEIVGRALGGGHRLWVVACVLASLLLGACDSPQGQLAQRQGAGQVTRNALANVGGRRQLASGVVFQGQQGDTVRHRLSAESISVVPRGFGAFNVNGINELFFEDAHIEIFPFSSEDTGKEGIDDRAIDFADTLQKFIDTLPDDYGVISRVRMRDVRITLHGVGKGGTAVNVVAGELLKEFRDDVQPELYEVKFYDGQSNAKLNVRRVRWKTRTGQFVVKAGSAG
jgi:hypothetical protein